MRRTAIVSALLLVSVLLGGCLQGLPDGVVYPSIVPDPTVTEDYAVDVAFTFEGRPVSFTLTVDGGLYAGAKAADKRVIRFGDARENDWVEGYFATFIAEEHQEPFFDALLGAFRAIQDERGLSSDRYAELLTAYVQSIAYKVDPDDLSPKFPVETFVDGSGDCDDKTLLLAALLAREGYDVAILLFEPEQHVALGIRSEDIPYLDTGFAYVETTVPSYIGQVPERLEGGVALSSVPRVLRVDGGSIPYMAGDEVRAILEAHDRAVAEARVLSGKISAADRRLSKLEQRISAERSELESLKASGRLSEYNARVGVYNALVTEYNTLLQQRNRLAADYNRLVELERVIASGSADRVGTYAKVRSFEWPAS